MTAVDIYIYHIPEVGSVIPVPNRDLKSSLHFLLNIPLSHDRTTLILLDSALVSSIRMTYDQMSICQKNGTLCSRLLCTEFI